MIRYIKNIGHLLTSAIAAVLFGFPSRKLTVIGVTGTDGKTTTANLIHAFLHEAGIPVGMISTLNARVGEDDIETGYHVTSPGRWRVQKLLRQMVQAGMTHVVVEATSHGLDQHRFFGVRFHTAVVTTISHEHLDYHRTYERYRAAKAKLFRNVEVSVLNADDQAYDYLRGHASGMQVSYGVASASDVGGSDLSIAFPTQFFSIDGTELSSPLLGHYNVHNVLAAIAAVRSFDIKLSQVQSALDHFEQLPGRFEPVDEGQPFSVIIDFAHTPDSLEKVLILARSIIIEPKLDSAVGTKGRVIVVFGCASERDVQKRPLMGKISIERADLSVFTAEDPRKEDVNAIIDDMVVGAHEAGGKENITYFREPDRADAIRKALSDLAKPGDIVIITGKGHEQSMCIGTVEHPWSDQTVTKQVLRELQHE